MINHAKEVILYLMKKVAELNVSKRYEAELKMELKLVTSFLGFSWVIMVILVFAFMTTHLLKKLFLMSK